MSKFAVIKTGGKQYLVKPGQKIKIEKMLGEPIFREILMIGDGDNFEFGKPTIKGAEVRAERVREGKARKVMVARYHSKTRYYKRKGHRQPFTEVLIKEIVAK